MKYVLVSHFLLFLFFHFFSKHPDQIKRLVLTSAYSKPFVFIKTLRTVNRPFTIIVNSLNLHYIKYARIGVFIDLYFPVSGQNRVDFVLQRENTGQWKPVVSHILCNVIPNNNFRFIDNHINFKINFNNCQSNFLAIKFLMMKST